MVRGLDPGVWLTLRLSACDPAVTKPGKRREKNPVGNRCSDIGENRIGIHSAEQTKQITMFYLPVQVCQFCECKRWCNTLAVFDLCELISS